MDAGIGNITEFVDNWDYYWMSPIDYSDWLGGTTQLTLFAQADRSGSARDVILTWEAPHPVNRWWLDRRAIRRSLNDWGP